MTAHTLPCGKFSHQPVADRAIQHLLRLLDVREQERKIDDHEVGIQRLHEAGCVGTKIENAGLQAGQHIDLRSQLADTKHVHRYCAVRRLVDVFGESLCRPGRPGGQLYPQRPSSAYGRAWRRTRSHDAGHGETASHHSESGLHRGASLEAHISNPPVSLASRLFGHRHLGRAQLSSCRAQRASPGG